METSTPLQPTVDAFLERTGMSAVTFGRLAMKDPHFVRDLRNGRRLWPETEQRVRDFMRDYPPTEPQRLAS